MQILSKIWKFQHTYTNIVDWHVKQAKESLKKKKEEEKRVRRWEGLVSLRLYFYHINSRSIIAGLF